MPFDLPVLLATGLATALIAIFAALADRRRLRRRDMDAIGWVPWTTVFFWAFVVAVVTLGLAAKAWLAN